MKSYFIKKIIIPFYASYKKMTGKVRIMIHAINGKKPWSIGYDEYKWQLIQRSIDDQTILDLFRNQAPLPKNYGVGVDERIVEYPWIISCLPKKPLRLLDAGSALNFSKILEHKVLSNKKITIVNLNPEPRCYWKKEISYLFDDIRNLPLKDNSFDVITCISTLEHIGMDNTAVYTKDKKYKENNSESYLGAIIELKRLLKQGGELLVTVPFGKYQNFGFFQQFDSPMVRSIVATFGGNNYAVNYYRYTNNGWQISDTKDSSGEKYFNIHEKMVARQGTPAAAGAVACLRLTKK